MPRFSILLPTHDRADVIGAAIESARAQTEADWELLVAGDGCTDGTAAVVEGFGDPRIRWFDLPKAPGFGYANRNVAMREARGDLVAFLAHDDLWLPDHLELMGAALAAPGCVWAYSRPLWIDDAGRIFPFFVNLRSPIAWRDFLEGRNILPASTVAHRRDAFEAAGGWPEDIPKAGDWALWKRIVTGGRPDAVGFVRRPTTLHFRAGWRDPTAHWGPPPLPYLEGVARSRGRWDARLTLAPNPADARPIQWQALDQVRAPGRVGRLRRGAEDLQDEIAWEAGLDRIYHGY